MCLRMIIEYNEWKVFDNEEMAWKVTQQCGVLNISCFEHEIVVNLVVYVNGTCWTQ